MKHKCYALKLFVLLCLCIILTPTLQVRAAETKREAYFYNWYGGIINEKNEILEDITVHVGETLLITYAYIDLEEGTIKPYNITSYPGAYYEWVITESPSLDSSKRIYENSKVVTWAPSVTNANYIYIKGISPTNSNDTYYLTLYWDSDYSEEPKVYASIPITVLPAENGVNYKDYGETKPSDLYTDKDSLLASMRKVFLNHAKGEYTFYATPEVANSVVTYDEILDYYYLDQYQIFHFYTDQGEIAAREGDYLEQNHYGFLSSSGPSSAYLLYRGITVEAFDLDTTGSEYTTTLEQEQAFENKLASLFAPGGALNSLKTASDYDKVVGCMKYINENVSYIGTTTAIYHTAYSGLCNGQATCQGYALLFYRMLRELGIENRILMGIDAGAHTYNIVLLNGKYYYCDVGSNTVLKGSNSFSHAELQERYLTANFQTNIMSRISNTDYDANAVPTTPTTYNGVDYAAVFNAEYYCKNNPDVAGVLGSDTSILLQHFVENGIAEGRQASSEFNLDAYKNNNPDLIDAFGNNNKQYYLHYINNGKAEGRDATTTSNSGSSTTIDYSAVFNAEYYYNNNPDVAGVLGNHADSLIQHFLNNGMDEGRQACAEFNVDAYKNNNPDVVAALGNNTKEYYLHYINHGKAEGRSAIFASNNNQGAGSVTDYSAVFNTEYYYNNNPDVAGVLGNDTDSLLKHFIANGMNEGRQACAEFNVNAYKNNNPDVVAALGDNTKEYYLHYINHGKAEGRSAISTNNGNQSSDSVTDYSAVFNAEYYYNNNPDIAAALGNNADALLQHFVNNGMSEGRQGCVTFNVNVYRNNNADLTVAFGDNLKEYYMHYIRCGASEGRTAY